MTAPSDGDLRGEYLANRAVPHMRQTPYSTPINTWLRAAVADRGELLFETFSRRYERGSIIVTSNLPFDEWTSVFGSERLTGALLDRLTHHVHILEMNGESYRLRHAGKATSAPETSSPD